ncbi:hypothetical protein HKD37_12G034300 [Glycine soja]
MIFHSPLLQKRHPNPKTSFFTTQDHRWSPLLAVGPPHEEEYFNKSGILKILLEDSTTDGRRKPSLLAVGPPHQEEYFNRSRILIILLEDLMEKIPQSSISKFL